MSITLYLRRFIAFGMAHWIVSGLVLLILLGGGYWYYVAHRAVTHQFVVVSEGSITETVSVTGNTTPMHSVSLGFQNSGTIARVYYAVGDHVQAGNLIAELNTASLAAALQQAQAAYNAAVASRSSTSLPDTATEARNTYLSAYTTLDTVLHSDVDTFFGGPTAYGPQLLITAPMYNYGELPRERAALDDAMQTYERALPQAKTADPVTLLASATALTQEVSTFLNRIAVAANDQNSGATSAQLTALATARSSVDTLLAKLSTARDSYRTGSVGATALADANVEEAAARVAVAKANLQGTQIITPISGVITVQDAKVGQVASPSASLVSVISASAYEVDAGVPETNVGKIAVGNTVSMTLDAFPGETFSGTVFYIDPAQTVSQGVVDYKIKIAFATPDPRMKSGLTANLTIQTRHKDSVLLLPQYAILQNDNGTFVQILQDGAVSTVPVTLGLQDEKGNVEILSGVTLDEQVLNIGLKQ